MDLKENKQCLNVWVSVLFVKVRFCEARWECPVFDTMELLVVRSEVRGKRMTAQNLNISTGLLACVCKKFDFVKKFYKDSMILRNQAKCLSNLTLHLQKPWFCEILIILVILLKSYYSTHVTTHQIMHHITIYYLVCTCTTRVKMGSGSLFCFRNTGYVLLP